MKLGDLSYNYQSIINEEIKKLSATICRGACETYSDYQLQVGVIKGYQDSIEILKQAIKATQSQEDED